MPKYQVLGSPKWECPYCEQSYYYQVSLTDHILYRHPVEHSHTAFEAIASFTVAVDG